MEIKNHSYTKGIFQNGIGTAKLGDGPVMATIGFYKINRPFFTLNLTKEEVLELYSLIEEREEPKPKLDGLEVTDVIVFPVKNKPEGTKLKAFAKVILNDQFLINGIRIIEGRNGLFVAWPSEGADDGKRYDICRAIRPETNEYISEQVMAQFNLTMSKAEPML